MEQYQKDFVDFTLETGVLKFGEFTLKSGRVSPYFFNAGLFNTGSHLSELGKFYAHAIVASSLEFDAVSYTHLRAHETKANLVCRLLLEKKKKTNKTNKTNHRNLRGKTA